MNSFLNKYSGKLDKFSVKYGEICNKFFKVLNEFLWKFWKYFKVRWKNNLKYWVNVWKIVGNFRNILYSRNSGSLKQNLFVYIFIKISKKLWKNFEDDLENLSKQFWKPSEK